MSVAEIEAAIDALAAPEQMQIYSDLTAKLFHRPHKAADEDPFTKLLDEIDREPSTGKPTDVAPNYKEHLYGFDSDD